MKIQIPRCYDSHTHLLATGQMHSMLPLQAINDPRDLSALKLQSEFNRGDWLVGFGWDQHRFPGQKFPTRFDLDQKFPDRPVAFSRIDGHALWCNTLALKICGLLRPVRDWNLPPGGEAPTDAEGLPTGILIDRAMELVFAKVPPDGKEQKKQFIRQACQVFNQQGFTHLRDMSGDEEQFQILSELDAAGEFTLYLDQNFSFEKPEDFEGALDLAVRAAKEKSVHLRSRGIKFYLDGALGSEGAALSRPYRGEGADGFLLWSAEQISGWIRQAWEKGVEVSVHTIGDRASHLVVTEAAKLWQKMPQGFLNLEHAEVIRSETLMLLKDRPVRLHVQPCHWLSDRPWLKEKLGPLFQSVFPWKQAADLGLPLSWGSDSPIEPPSLKDNHRALIESVTEIPAYPGVWWEPHMHPDLNWGPACLTTLSDDHIAEVIFDGRSLLGHS